MLIEEKFELNGSTSGVTAADGLGATWAADIWNFQLPLNTWLLLRPGDIFSCYLIGDDAAEMPATTQVRVVIRDVNNQEALPILKDTLYQSLKSFTDRDKVVALDIARERIVGPDERIAIMVNGADATGTGDTDASASHFKLVTRRRRKPLGG